MKALLIVLLVLVLLGLFKVGIHFVWDGGAKVQLLLWKIRISFPKKKRDKPEKPERKQKAGEPDSLKKEKTGGPSGKGWLHAALAYWQEILELIGKVFHTPKLDVLILRVTVGGPDPAACALNYGRTWALLGGMLPVLENTFRIGTRDIDVRCAYDRPETTCFAQVDLTVRIYEILVLGVLGLKLLIQIYQAYKSTQKAVQST